MKTLCSLVIPLYNESKNIPHILNNAEKFLQHGNELVLVNNGSIDNTKELLNKLENKNNIKIINIDKNRGFGHGVWTGLQSTSNLLVAYSHGDLQCDINDVLEGVKLIKTKDFLIKGQRTGRKIVDLIFTKLMTFFCLVLFKKNMVDIHAQPNIFTKKLMEDLKYPPIDFSLDAYLYLLCKKHSYEIIRFNTKFLDRKFGEGSNDKIIQKIFTSFKEIFSLIKLKGNNDLYY
tara:strand:+ start:557 stop:1252 length:696 start_codon:yes stop_codon:yes gene_type:complete